MEAKTFLSMEPENPSLAPSTPILDYRDFQRTVVLFSSFRSGSHMLKLSLGRLAGMVTPPEPFNAYADSGSGYTLQEYLRDPNPKPDLMTEGASSVHHFLQSFYSRMPEKKKIVMDVKYPQAYAFGTNADMDYAVPVPTVLDEMNKLGMPIIHLRRRDKVAQAVSLLVAEGTGVYLSPDGTASNKADAAMIRLNPAEVFERAMRFQNGSDNAVTVLTAMGANVLNVTYEDLLSDHSKEQYRKVFRFVDRYADIPEGFKPPTRAQNSSGRVSNLTEVRAYAFERLPELLGGRL